MREHRSRPAGEDSGEPAPLDPEPVMPIGVDAPVKAMKTAIAHPVRDSAVTQAKRGHLSEGDHTPLAPRNLSQSGLGVFPFHLARKSAQPRKLTPFTAVVRSAVRAASGLVGTLPLPLRALPRDRLRDEDGLELAVLAARAVRLQRRTRL